MDTLIKADDVGKTFGSVNALNTVTVDISRGEIIGIVGPSGAGKTTMIRLLLGLYKPSHGEVTVFDKAPGKFDRMDRERIGYLPQQFLLYEDLTVRENLLFAAGTYGLGPRERRHRIDALLERLDLADASDRLARDISGGMQRRVALAATLVHQPDLIVLDEPTAGLDPVLRESIWEMFGHLRENGATLVVTTQYITETERCDRILLINNGQVVASDSPDGLRDQVFGGELVRLKSEALSDDLAAKLLALDFVRDGRRTSPKEMEIVVESAHAAIPRLIGAMNAEGHEIEEIEEVQISLDTVFVELVRRSSDVQE
ncbi:MAG: ABC transporter ATP-binding protein [Thermomicrobiales bacterium]